MDVPLTIWLAVLGVIVVMLAIDLFAHRDAHVISAKEAAIWSAVWVAMGRRLRADHLGHRRRRSSPGSTTPAT